jgi:alkylation response protein AidB-like acyl-CoA dehydrogenase
MSFMSYCLALEEISAADCGVGTIVHVHNMSHYPIARFGTAAQKQQSCRRPRAARRSAPGC